MNRKEQKECLGKHLKEFQDELTHCHMMKKRGNWAEDTDPFDAEGEIRSQIKFFTIAIKLAPKDHKKLQRLHAEISERSNNTLEILMEQDHTFAESEIGLVSTSPDATCLRCEPGKDGLGEAIRIKGDHMKYEYDMREFLVKNWMNITRN